MTYTKNLKEYCTKDALIEKKLHGNLCSEGERILFLLNRDGLKETIKWAKRTMVIYRIAVLDKRHHASLKQYRRSFITSHLILKRFIKDNDA